MLRRVTPKSCFVLVSIGSAGQSYTCLSCYPRPFWFYHFHYSKFITRVLRITARVKRTKFIITTILFCTLVRLRAGEIMFFGSSLVIYILFIHLAREWPKVMGKWEIMEREMRQFGYMPNTALKFKVLASVVMIFSLSTFKILHFT